MSSSLCQRAVSATSVTFPNPPPARHVLASLRFVLKPRAAPKHQRSSRSWSLSCKSTSDDSHSAVTGESILSKKQSLEQELQVAIELENYAEAARIKDRIRVLHEDCEASVLAVNARFYNAFRKGDLASMQDLWAKGDNVCCVHPGAGGISGYDFVMRSWEYVWVDYEFPLDIEIKDVLVHTRGDMGYVTCMEMVRTKGSSWGRQFATNVFERIDACLQICFGVLHSLFFTRLKCKAASCFHFKGIELEELTDFSSSAFQRGTIDKDSIQENLRASALELERHEENVAYVLKKLAIETSKWLDPIPVN